MTDDALVPLSREKAVHVEALSHSVNDTCSVLHQTDPPSHYPPHPIPTVPWLH